MLEPARGVAPPPVFDCGERALDPMSFSSTDAAQLAQSLPDGVLVLDEDGTIRFTRRHLADLTGYTEGAPSREPCARPARATQPGTAFALAYSCWPCSPSSHSRQTRRTVVGPTPMCWTTVIEVERWDRMIGQAVH